MNVKACDICTDLMKDKYYFMTLTIAEVAGDSDDGVEVVNEPGVELCQTCFDKVCAALSPKKGKKPVKKNGKKETPADKPPGKKRGRKPKVQTDGPTPPAAPVIP